MKPDGRGGEKKQGGTHTGRQSKKLGMGGGGSGRGETINKECNERGERKGKGENTHCQNRTRRETDGRDNRMEGMGARRKKSFSKRDRSISMDSHGAGPACKDKNKEVKILFTNTQSIISKINKLSAVADDRKPDLVLLPETWCNTSTDNATLTIPDFNLELELRRDREDTGQGVGGGLLVYS
jgi:hypothetical protein